VTAKVTKNSNRGSRPGERRGGRQKGTRNKRTAALIHAAEAGGMMPLDLMLRIMRDEACPEGADPAQKIAFHSLRFEAAKAAAPYVHPRLSQRDEPVKIGSLTGSLAEQGTQVLAAIAEGRVTPSQGTTVLQALAAQANITKIDDLARRVASLEDKRNAAKS